MAARDGPSRNIHAKDESRAGRRRSHRLTVWLFSKKHGTRVNSGPSWLLAKSGLQEKHHQRLPQRLLATSRSLQRARLLNRQKPA